MAVVGMCCAIGTAASAQEWRTAAAAPLSPVADAYPHVSRQGRVVFQSNRLGGWRLFVLDSAGANARLLLAHDSTAVTPVWSPDGRQIVFASDRDGNSEIYVVNADGTGLRRVTRDPASDSHPNWSPDGRQIVFCSTRGDGQNDDIYVINLDGSALRRLTDNGLTWDTFPSFSPDGRRILFRQLYRARVEPVGITTVNSEIMIMNVDGSGLTNLSRDARFDGWPSWSPDGRRIAFSSNRSDVYQVYTMAADGSDVRAVATGPYVQVRPQWGPDGSWLVFNVERDGAISLWRAPVERE